MRILTVVEKEGTAIWRLAQGVKKYNPQFNIDVVAVHPKRPDVDQLNTFYELAKKADILDFQYWKTYVMLRDNYPELMNKKKILSHHNPYNIYEEKWEELDAVVANNATIHSKLKKNFIPLGVDAELFKFNKEYKGDKIQMVSGRIESKKGILPVAEACKGLGLKMLLIGSVSDGEYFKKIMDTGVVEFREKVSDQELVNSYYESKIHVCNSIDDYESGTMPILEAMLCGTPVLTRNIGHVPDINNDRNMFIRHGNPEDIEDIKESITKMLSMDLDKMRNEAWNTAKAYNDLRRARRYEKLFWEVYSKQPLVSVIIPTFNRKEILSQVLISVFNQDYPAIEIIVCDDGSTDDTQEMIKKVQGQYPIKYVNTNTTDEYNLAYARNLGVIESSGKYLMFLDDRYELEQDCISKMVENMYPQRWVFGNKGNKKTTFVENFSMIHRKEFIMAGMFNQSCKMYGFQSQELRERFRLQRFKLNYVESARAKIISKTKNRYNKKEEILKAKDILFKLGL